MGKCDVEYEPVRTESSPVSDRRSKEAVRNKRGDSYRHSVPEFTALGHVRADEYSDTGYEHGSSPRTWCNRQVLTTSSMN